MSVRRRRDQRMTGDSAPPIQRTEAERRALLERLERLRTPQEPRVEWLDRGTEGRRGTEHSRTTPPRRRSSRHTSPPQTRTDPTYAPPRQTLSEGERREIIERASPPQSSGGVEWLPPTVASAPEIGDQPVQEQAVQSDSIRQDDRSTALLDRATSLGSRALGRDSNDLRRQLRREVGSLEHAILLQELQLEFARRGSQRGLASLPPRRTDRFYDDRPVLLLPPDRFAHQLGQDWNQLLREYPDAAPLGVLEGFRRVITDGLSAIGTLLSLILSPPDLIRESTEWIFALTESERDALLHLIRLDRQGFLLLGELIQNEVENPEILGTLLDVVMQPFDAIAEHFVEGVRADTQVESAARIIQGTFGFIELLGAVQSVLHSVRRSPRLVRSLQRLRERLTTSLQRARRTLRDEFPFRGSRDSRARGRRGIRQRGSLQIPAASRRGRGLIALPHARMRQVWRRWVTEYRTPRDTANDLAELYVRGLVAEGEIPALRGATIRPGQIGRGTTGKDYWCFRRAPEGSRGPIALEVKHKPSGQDLTTSDFARRSTGARQATPEFDVENWIAYVRDQHPFVEGLVRQGRLDREWLNPSWVREHGAEWFQQRGNRFIAVVSPSGTAGLDARARQIMRIGEDYIFRVEYPPEFPRSTQ